MRHLSSILIPKRGAITLLPLLAATSLIGIFIVALSSQMTFSFKNSKKVQGQYQLDDIRNYLVTVLDCNHFVEAFANCTPPDLMALETKSGGILIKASPSDPTRLGNYCLHAKCFEKDGEKKYKIEIARDCSETWKVLTLNDPLCE